MLLSQSPRANPVRAWVPLLATGAVFTLDLATPNGLAVPVLYMAVLSTLLRHNRRSIVLVAIGLSACTAMGAFVGSALIPFEHVLVNRAFALVAIWIVTTLLLVHEQHEVRAAEERERANAMLRQVLEAAPDGIILTRPSGEITYANRALEVMFGYERGELDGITIESLVPETHRSRHASRRGGWLLERRARVMAQGHETNGLRRDGTTLPIEVSLTALENGMPLVIVRDVSQRRTLEERIRATQRMEAVGRLSGGIAHDFNNLLAIISTYGCFVLEALEAEHPARRDLMEVLAATERAAALTSQLLAFSRRQLIEPRRLDVSILLTDLSRMLIRTLGTDIEISTVLDERLWTVEMDPSQFEQVLLNLAVNARDAMPHGGKLTIEAANTSLDDEYAAQHPEVEPGEYIRISITDSGVGMSEHVRARVFEPFFTTKPVGKGTGLGLASVYGIVRQARGHIWVYSEPGAGTTFKVYLPRANGEPEAAVVRRSIIPKGGDETILVVEDEPIVRASTVRLLRNAGYAVVEASNGVDALIKCRACDGRLSLVVTDVVMPQMGGRELASKLAETWPEIRVLYVSGYTENAIVHHGVLDSGLVFLQKPYKREDLLSRVRQLLDA